MRSYLATIARNTSKNKLRKYHSNEVLNEQIISSDLTPQDNIIKAENSQFLTELITSLGVPDSEIFFRYYYYNEKNQNNFKSNEYFPVDSQNKTVSR